MGHQAQISEIVLINQGFNELGIFINFCICVNVCIFVIMMLISVNVFVFSANQENNCLKLPQMSN